MAIDAVKQRGDLAALARFMNASQRLRQQRVEPCPEDVDQHALTDCFRLHRFVRAAIPVVPIVLHDDRQTVLRDLFGSEHQPLPHKPCDDFAFKNVAGIALDQVAIVKRANFVVHKDVDPEE